MPPIQHRLLAVFASSVALPAAPKIGEPQPNPKWIHVVTEGNYQGYPGGGAEISRQTLEQIVRNFKADPRYEPPEGRVIPFDYAHVSELDPRVGDAGSNEAAAAWGTDVRLQEGSDRRAQLWVLTKLGDRVKRQIEAGEIAFVSIAFAPNAKHPMTGESIGAVMTSVAFTNKPFVQDLTPLAASTGAAGGGGGSDEIDLSNCSGRNPVEKMVAFMKATRPGFSTLTFHEQVRRAGEFLRENAGRVRFEARTSTSKAPIDLRAFSGRNPIEKAIAYLDAKETGFKDLGWSQKVAKAGQFCRDNHKRLITL